MSKPGKVLGYFVRDDYVPRLRFVIIFVVNIFVGITALLIRVTYHHGPLAVVSDTVLGLCVAVLLLLFFIGEMAG